VTGQAINFHPHHFRDNLSPDEARELFRASVSYVEIETFTYCNRKCYFCPNATMPERQDLAGNKFMDEALYLRILDELASVGFAGQVQFGRYNEPLSDRIILNRIGQARAKLPRAYLYTHTNGDFLTRRYLDDLRDAGLNELAVQTYLRNQERWDESKILLRQAWQLADLGLRVARPITAAPGLRHYHETNYPGMRVTLDARNFDAIGTDRGGLVQIRKNRPRTAPCLIPFSNLYVDWTGDVVPCCNIRSDRPEHVQFVACRLQDGHSIFDAFAALHSWRKGLMRFGPKSGPCATCRYDEDAVSEGQAENLERIYGRLMGVLASTEVIRAALATDSICGEQATCP
jgi:MoaA/NifB/PqqE/SkfB family radical SAM enzyme